MWGREMLCCLISADLLTNRLPIFSSCTFQNIAVSQYGTGMAYTGQRPLVLRSTIYKWLMYRDITYKIMTNHWWLYGYFQGSPHLVPNVAERHAVLIWGILEPYRSMTENFSDSAPTWSIDQYPKTSTSDLLLEGFCLIFQVWSRQ